jgi:hypothetical protein
LYRPIAVCLALVGQVVGTFGLPAVRGSSNTHASNAACGCCPMDRSAGHCCCHHEVAPVAEELPPCCRGKKEKAAPVTWVIPNLRSKCQEPHDTVPGSIMPASIPPEAPAHWTGMSDDAGAVSTTPYTLESRSAPPDDPPPRVC